MQVQQHSTTKYSIPYTRPFHICLLAMFQSCVKMFLFCVCFISREGFSGAVFPGTEMCVTQGIGVYFVRIYYKTQESRLDQTAQENAINKPKTEFNYRCSCYILGLIQSIITCQGIIVVTIAKNLSIVISMGGPFLAS